MPLPIIISSFIIGVCIWLVLYSIIIDSEELGCIFALVAFLVLLIGLVACGMLTTIQTKAAETKEFEFYKFKSYTVLIVNDKVYYSNKAKMYNSISEKSKVEFLIEYNSYGNENGQTITIDGKKFE